MLLPILLFWFVIVVDAAMNENFKRENDSMSSTEERKEFANAILTNINDSVDPCVDFYKYSCGNWPRTHPSPSGKDYWTVFTIAENENKRKIDELLKSDIRDDEIQPVKIVKQWYKACMDTENMEKRGMEPLLSVLNGIGGWPITMTRDKWLESGEKWQKVDDYYARLKGSNSLHDVRVAVYGRDANEMTAVLDVPDLPPYSWMLQAIVDSEGYPRLNKRKNTKKYWKFMLKIVSNVIKAVGSNVSNSQIEEDIEDMLDFQLKLLTITKNVDTYVNMTAKSFQRWYDGLNPHTGNAKVNWTDKIVGIFRASGIDFSDDALVKVSSLKYFRELVNLLDKTSNRTIVNYLHWHFVSRTIVRTTTAMRNLYDRMIPSQKGEEQTRSKRCVDEARMNDVIAYEYIKSHLSNSTIDKVYDMLNDIEREIEIEIKGSNWANKMIKKWALRRIRSVVKNIAYPDWYNNATIMEHYFEGLRMGSTYFENALELEKYYKFKELRQLKYQDELSPWMVDLWTINAFYLSESNSINIPMASLEKPFFSLAYPNAINYAMAGHLLAHEMYHPFDVHNDEEIKWSKEMTKKYNKSARCFIEQFNNYTVNGTFFRKKIENYGDQTFSENMPDTMGLRAAFKAYKRRERINGESDSRFLGLETFNNHQLFFLSFANLWCESIKPKLLFALAKLDVHSVPRLRVNGAVSNNKDFADAFACPLNSPMNPKKKCNIW